MITSIKKTHSLALRVSTQFCDQLVVAIADLKVRLQESYEKRFPGQSQLIEAAIAEAEVRAWRTAFPHLFLPDFAEARMARLLRPALVATT